MNVVMLSGKLSRSPEVRMLPSGDRVVSFEVTTRPPDGPAETVPVTWLDAPDRVTNLPADAEVVVTGRVRRRFFRAGGATASRTEVAADAVVPATQRKRVATLLGAALEAVDRPGGG